MAKIIILGTANAVSDEHHENTHLCVITEQRTILIDCVGNPMVHLRKAGINPHQVTDLVLTHFHPDHVSGFPLLLMDLWLTGRKQGIKIYGLEYTIERAKSLMDMYDWQTWPHFFPVEFCVIPEEEGAVMISDTDVHIQASPVKHLLPTMGMRIDFLAEGKTMVYTSDTEPCDAVIRLAKNADVLIHEASGATLGHSSAQQAGQIARQAGAKSLYLIHYPTNANPENLLADVNKEYLGPAQVTVDFMQMEL